MALVFILVTAAIAGIIYGIVKKNKTLLVASIIFLIIIAMLLLIYSYLYSKNPY